RRRRLQAKIHPVLDGGKSGRTLKLQSFFSVPFALRALQKPEAGTLACPLVVRRLHVFSSQSSAITRHPSGISRHAFTRCAVQRAVFPPPRSTVPSIFSPLTRPLYTLRTPVPAGSENAISSPRNWVENSFAPLASAPLKFWYCWRKVRSN